jgi:UDP-3-O-acyl-N-acetylglucosamine deacetylase
MVEHLLAACAGLGITDLLADVAGRELPFGDGSAMPYVRLLRRAGRRGLAADLPPIELRRPVAVGGGGFIIAVPARTLRISCLAGIPGQPAATVAVRPTGRQFEQELAPARTFGDSRLQPARLRRVLRLGFGLARIGRTVVPARSRLPDEACRHKLLDLLGDLWLLGRPLRAHLFAFRPGHELNLRFARALARDLEV